VTLYRVKTSKVGKVTTIDVPCPKSLTQACAHYYSVIKADRSEAFSCSAHHNAEGRLDSPATDDWEKGHKDDTWKAFTAAEYDYTPEKKGLVVKCEADEWPPTYFLSEQQMKQGTKSTKGQLVRWIPKEPNQAAGKLWSGWCKGKDGDIGNGQRGPRVNNAQWEQGGEYVHCQR